MSQLGSMSPYMIGGGLNFGSNPGTDYQSAYQNALSLNQQNYNNILSGYQGLGQAQGAAQNQIQQGYGQLSQNVLGTISGIGASQAQAINDVYAQQSGSMAQGLVSSGLGNTTVADTMQRGALLDRTKAQTGLANQMAQLTAGYQSSLGLAGLNYANQANMQNTALGSQQLGFMNSVNAPYPNLSQYNQLAQIQGQLAQGQKYLNMYGMGMGRNGGGMGGANVTGAKGTFAGVGSANPGSAIMQGSYAADYPSAAGAPVQAPVNTYGSSQYDEAGTGIVPPGGPTASAPTQQSYPAYDPSTMNAPGDNSVSYGGDGAPSEGDYSEY